MPKKSEEKLKPCCACPETREIRDKCVVEHGESECAHFIAAHKACLEALGIKL